MGVSLVFVNHQCHYGSYINDIPLKFKIFVLPLPPFLRHLGSKTPPSPGISRSAATPTNPLPPENTHTCNRTHTHTYTSTYAHVHRHTHTKNSPVTGSGWVSCGALML